jgi:hypothetical protein
VQAPFANSAAVTPGQGQAVTIAGVQVGQVGGVRLENGRAMVTMNIFRRYAPLYRDATVLLRPRTPLKDMYLALDPGTKRAAAIPDGGMLSAAATSPTVDLDQILARSTPTPAATCCCCSAAARRRSAIPPADSPPLRGRGPLRAPRRSRRCAPRSSASRRWAATPGPSPPCWRRAT